MMAPPPSWNRTKTPGSAGSPRRPFRIISVLPWRSCCSPVCVREYFKPFGIADRIREFDVSSATVELAAVAVGVEGARIAKSMSFKVGEEPIIIVVAGDAKVDNSRYKAQFHTKAKMLTFEEAHTMIGHDPGGVCSFALPENVKTYLDISLKRFETVFPAAGSSNSAIELTCEELEKYSSNFVSWVDVAKGWRPEEKEA